MDGAQVAVGGLRFRVDTIEADTRGTKRSRIDYRRTKFSSPLTIQLTRNSSCQTVGYAIRKVPRRRGTREKKRKRNRNSHVTFLSTLTNARAIIAYSSFGGGRRTNANTNRGAVAHGDVSNALLLRERISEEEEHAIRWTHLRGQQRRRLIRPCVIRTVHSGPMATRLRYAHIRGLEFITSSNLYLFAVSCPPTPPGLAPCRSHLPAHTWHLTSPAASSNTCHLAVARVDRRQVSGCCDPAAPRRDTARTISSHVDTSLQAGMRA